MAVAYLIKRKPQTSKTRKLKRFIAFRFLFNATKREKLIFTSLLLTTTLLLGAFVDGPLWFALFALSGAACAVLVLFAFKEDIAGLRYFFIPLFPVLFTLAAHLILYAIPMHSSVIFVLAMVYGVLVYLVLLISNIFNISAMRTIPLIRAAHAASFFLNLVTIFFLCFFLATLKIHPLLLIPGAFLTVVLPCLYLFWSFGLETVLTRQVMVKTITVAIIVAETALVLGFWPISPLEYGLFLTIMVYLCVGILHQEMVNLLRKRIIIEYSLVLGFALMLLFITAKWI